MIAPKKLIESALPLDDINREAAREKSIRHGHPSTLHLWWARRPLAAARAVLFAQLVNAPKTKKRKEELFDLIRELVKWENSNDEALLARARKEIMASWRETCAEHGNDAAAGYDPHRLPAFHDPFAGGGAIPLEAQRLGLEAYASDLNPVAVMINKAMIEIPPRFAGRAPIGPLPPGEPAQADALVTWPGATGLAEDVRRYGYWMREEAKKRIGHLYPPVEVTAEMAQGRPDLKPYVGRKLTVIAWLWARTVKSPDPRFRNVHVPLVSSYVLSKKTGKEVWMEPVVEGDKWRFEIRLGKPPDWAEKGNKTNTRSSVTFKCLLSGMPIPGDDIKTLGQQGKIGQRLIAIVCEGDRGRVYIPALPAHEQVAATAKPTWRPSGKISARRITGGTCVPYGLDEWGKLFTDRQLVALDTFSDLVQEARGKALADATAAWGETGGTGVPPVQNGRDGRSPSNRSPCSCSSSGHFPSGHPLSLADGGAGALAYADAVAVYQAFAVDKCTDYWSNVCSWHASGEKMRNSFGRQAITMAWDYAECNPLCDSTGNWMAMSDWVWEVVKHSPTFANGSAAQSDAQTQSISQDKIISTDPPYYDNISYADWSDFFYVWLRRSLRNIFPSVFATMATPKDEELVAVPYRHGGVEAAEKFFLNGMTATMRNLAERAQPDFPVTIYYAFKQSDTDADGTSNAGWETFLEALMRAGFSITGTWPMRTEMANRQVGMDSNALASSIVLVCRKRPADAPETTRREFLTELKEAMPKALAEMKGGTEEASPVAPVDLAQAAIGPGMEVFSKYAAVRKADGSAMSVHEAIVEINKYVGDGNPGPDPATLFCQDWLATHGWAAGPFGDANTLAQAKGTTVDRVADAGVIVSGAGKVRLVRPRDYPEGYDPTADRNRPLWEACHHLVAAFDRGGSRAAGALLAKMPEVEEDARDLCYALYTLCERKGWAEDARAYNQIMAAWTSVQEAARAAAAASPRLTQGELF